MSHFEWVFGESSSFAIRLRNYNAELVPGWKYAYAHLILDNYLIGRAGEYCDLGTWLPQLVRLHSQLSRIHAAGELSVFTGLSIREAFELIRKSNQDEDDFSQDYLHLPAPDTDALWVHHSVTLDETIDAYLIAAVSDGGGLRIMWLNYWENGAFHSVTLQTRAVLETIRQVIVFCLKTFPELNQGTDRWKLELSSFLHLPDA